MVVHKTTGKHYFATDSNLVLNIADVWEEAKKKIIGCAYREKASHSDKGQKREYKVGEWVRALSPAVQEGHKKKAAKRSLEGSL